MKECYVIMSSENPPAYYMDDYEGTWKDVALCVRWTLIKGNARRFYSKDEAKGKMRELLDKTGRKHGVRKSL